MTRDNPMLRPCDVVIACFADIIGAVDEYAPGSFLGDIVRRIVADDGVPAVAMMETTLGVQEALLRDDIAIRCSCDA